MRFTALTLFAFACSTSASSVPSTPFAAPPFSAEQIRSSTPIGRTYTWRIAAEGKTFTRVLRFVQVGPERLTFEAVNFADDGTPLGEAKKSSTTWDEIVNVSTHLQDGTVITEERIAVPAGEFDCMLYTITERRGPKTMVTRAWYAKELPGAPIKLEVVFQGLQVVQQELMAHDPGSIAQR